ncbi:phosphatase PAP2 family protein [Sphingorhabdus arenilitoris]|uniref:Phosphatase PAP2 family protein n=1 Tax=Sphingorhabdus arenilitoris TaxID=1490041 RepID=A0ABV8RFW5_9SPHN
MSKVARALPLLGLAAILLALTAVLGFAVDAGWIAGVDLALSQALNLRAGISPDWLIAATQAVSWIGGGTQRYLMVALLALALWRYWGAGAGLAMGLTSLFSSIASDAAKLYFARPRPELVPHLDPITSFAYTSGHSASAATVYLLFILLMPGKVHPGWQAAAAALILLTGLSRVMLGVHWPSDVLGGWMLGAGFAVGAYAIIQTKKEAKFGKGNTGLHARSAQ